MAVFHLKIKSLAVLFPLAFLIGIVNVFKGQLPQERQMKPITVSQLTKCLTHRLTWDLDGGSIDFFFPFLFVSL